MRTRPIIFSGDSVRRILEGKKSQTRRVVKGTVKVAKGYSCAWFKPKQNYATVQSLSRLGLLNRMRYHCPHGMPDDQLWVKETARLHAVSGHNWFDLFYKADKEFVQYKGSETGPYKFGKYTSPWFMPRWASRITLLIKKIRVEQLQDISEEDVFAETGAPLKWPGPGPEPYERDLVGAFAALWNVINDRKDHRWADNPFVWVIEFERIENE